jgi:hypothetical protein
MDRNPRSRNPGNKSPLIPLLRGRDQRLGPRSGESVAGDRRPSSGSRRGGKHEHGQVWSAGRDRLGFKPETAGDARALIANAWTGSLYACGRNAVPLGSKPGDRQRGRAEASLHRRGCTRWECLVADHRARWMPAPPPAPAKAPSIPSGPGAAPLTEWVPSSL